MSGTLALIGGEPFDPRCTFNQALIEAADATQVVLLPTAAAFEHPDRVIADAGAYFGSFDVEVHPVHVLTRADAMEAVNADALRAARVIVLVGSSALHARPALQGTPVWEAVVAAWNDGATVIGADAGAQILCDPMVDDRGGAFTVGLGLIDRVAVLTRRNTWSDDALARLRQMTNPDLAVIGIDDATAAIRSPAGEWRADGAGSVEVHIGPEPATLADLSALSSE